MNPNNESAVLIGASQSGKTTYAKQLIKILRHAKHNVIILDPHFKFTALAPQAVVRNLNQLTGEGLQILQPFEFTNVNAEHEFFKRLLHHARALSTLVNFVLVIDELHNWFKTKQSNVAELEWWCRNCHNRQCSYLGIFQAPSEVPNYIVRNAAHRFILYLDLPTDQDYMKKFIGKEIYQFSKGEIPQFMGIYKKQGSDPERFEVDDS